MNLLDIIKITEATHFIDYGVAVAWTDIFNAADMERNMLDGELRKLASSGKIELCVNELHDKNLIIAVKLI